MQAVATDDDGSLTVPQSECELDVEEQVCNGMFPYLQCGGKDLRCHAGTACDECANMVIQKYELRNESYMCPHCRPFIISKHARELWRQDIFQEREHLYGDIFGIHVTHPTTQQARKENIRATSIWSPPVVDYDTKLRSGKQAIADFNNNVPPLLPLLCPSMTEDARTLLLGFGPVNYQ